MKWWSDLFILARVQNNCRRFSSFQLPSLHVHRNTVSHMTQNNITKCMSYMSKVANRCHCFILVVTQHVSWYHLLQVSQQTIVLVSKSAFSSVHWSVSFFHLPPPNGTQGGSGEDSDDQGQCTCYPLVSSEWKKKRRLWTHCSKMNTPLVCTRVLVPLNATMDASLNLSCSVYARIVPVGVCYCVFLFACHFSFLVMQLFSYSADEGLHGRNILNNPSVVIYITSLEIWRMCPSVFTFGPFTSTIPRATCISFWIEALHFVVLGVLSATSKFPCAHSTSLLTITLLLPSLMWAGISKDPLTKLSSSSSIHRLDPVRDI